MTRVIAACVFVSAVLCSTASEVGFAQSGPSAMSDVPGLRPRPTLVPDPAAMAVLGVLGSAPSGGATGTLATHLFRPGTPGSTCGSVTPPGNFGTGPFIYNVHYVTNPSVTTCVTVTLTVLNTGTDTGNVQVAAFLAPFAPADISNSGRFLGDAGLSSGNPPEATSFQLTIPAAATIALVVMNTNPSPQGQGAIYRLDFTQNLQTPLHFPPADFDGEGKTDLSVFRPGTGEWWHLRSSDSAVGYAQFGQSTDVIVPGDYTGDAKIDVAVWRPSTGTWWVRRSENGTIFAVQFGAVGDIPAPADYDGDGTTDMAVYRPSETIWYIRRSLGGVIAQTQGAAGDLPVSADYDGDGKADLALFRPSAGLWSVLRSSGGVTAVAFGTSTDRAVPGDYTGDAKADIAVWRPSTGFWYVLRSENSTFYGVQFGATNDLPTPGDFDGDGIFDVGVFRPSDGTWYVQRSLAGMLTYPFGAGTDRPVPNAFVR